MVASISMQDLTPCRLGKVTDCLHLKTSGGFAGQLPPGPDERALSQPRSHPSDKNG